MMMMMMMIIVCSETTPSVSMLTPQRYNQVSAAPMTSNATLPTGLGELTDAAPVMQCSLWAMDTAAVHAELADAFLAATLYLQASKLLGVLVIPARACRRTLPAQCAA